LQLRAFGLRADEKAAAQGSLRVAFSWRPGKRRCGGLGVLRGEGHFWEETSMGMTLERFKRIHTRVSASGHSYGGDWRKNVLPKEPEPVGEVAKESGVCLAELAEYEDFCDWIGSTMPCHT